MTSRAPSPSPDPPCTALAVVEQPPEPSHPTGLTPKQARFCEAYVQAGDGNAAGAAREAGYPESDARQTGWKLLRHEGCQTYIAALTQSGIGLTAPQAVRTLTELLEHRSGFVRAQAAVALLDRGGHRVPASGQGRGTGAGTVTISIDLGAA